MTRNLDLVQFINSVVKWHELAKTVVVDYVNEMIVKSVWQKSNF